MQIVEAGPGDFALAHFVHRRFVAEAPAIGEGDPVEVQVLGLAPGYAFGDYRAAPVDDCAEDIEDDGFHVGWSGFHYVGLCGNLRYWKAGAKAKVGRMSALEGKLTRTRSRR